MALNIDPDILTKVWDGDADSQLLIGKAYFNAVYTKENCSDAFKWIHRSAEQGNMEAQYRLGDLLALGQGTCKSYTEAYKWYTKAALQGYKKALIRIFNIYQQDKKMHCRGKLNSQKGKWTGSSFLESDRLKHHASQLNHAITYYTDLFNELKSRNKEDPDTSFKLGFHYQYGYGVKKCIKLAIDYYKEAAEKGNIDAQYHLGYLYENGTDIKFNYYLALRWYRTSATNGNIAAQNALGYFYEKGLATELKFEGAIYWYSKAANSGNSDAQLTLGKLYRKGEGVDVDISQAIKWYTLAANQGNGAAQNCLNQLYRNEKKSQLSGTNNNTGYVGEHQTKPTLRSKLQDDIEKMNGLPHIKQLTKLVEHALRTDGNSMFTLGIKYYNGEDFTQDKDTGFQWMKKAAKTGLQEAELKIAEIYYNGDDDVVDQDYHESSIWTTKVVMKKNSKAQCDLGLLYLSGEGVRYDPLEASKWFTKSADQGNSEAQYQLGLLRFEGLGLRKDMEEALEWFNKSGHNRNTNALYELGTLYEVGTCLQTLKCLKKGECDKSNICVRQDLDRAIKLFEYSAKNGNLLSQYLMAEYYEYGDPVKQDLQKSEKYYKLAVNRSAEIKYKLARGYMLGTFGNADCIKAFELFKEIANDEPSSRYNILQTPISYQDQDMVYTKLVDMLKLVSNRGEQETCYNIGYLYENGMYYWSRVLFHPSYTDAIQWYSAAATNGDSRAQYRLGVMYEEGKGVEIDLSTAYNYYSEAYKNGIDGADYRLALMYLNGEGAAQDFLKAYCLFTEASNRGHKKAYKQLVPSEISDNLKVLEAVANTGYIAVQYQLGVFYQEKRENDEEALKWLSLASKGGVTDAFYRLGVIYEELKGNSRNYSKAIQLYSEAIKKDHDDAMYRLARIYHLGKGVKRDYQRAYDLYTRAAELGHSKSSRLLDITNDSVGKANVVKYSKDLKDTLLMMKSIAKRGNNSDLQYNLGTFYITNKSHLNYNEAFKWYQMAAASKENSDALYQLGLLYENGQGTIQNYSMAYNLYTQAKQKGHRDAIYRLGLAYQYGSGGVNINNSEAMDYFIKAAELGSNESQYKLGKLYESGDLVEKDTLKALKWYTKAYNNGNCNVFQNLYQLYEEKPLESYFYKRLFSTLSNIEKIDVPYKGSTTITLLYGSFYFKLGMMYLEGRGTTENLVKALKQFLKAYYDYGYDDAQPFISVKYRPNSLVFLGNYFDKLEAYLKMGDEIPARHQYKLGILYYHGLQYVSIEEGDSSNNPTITTVLKPNHHQAYKYFNLASKKRHAKSQEQIALMYLRGDYVKRDQKIAFERFTTAAELMPTRECSSRGMDFYHGHNVEQNHQVAKIYLQKAATMHDDKAQTCLDKIQLEEIEKEQRKSSNTMNRFEEEIKNMDPDLLYERGVQLYKGSFEGVKNYDLSLFYIRKTAEKNHNYAMAQLGKMYLDGKAVKKDSKEAMKWIEKSIKDMDSDECYEQGMVFYNDKNYKISSLYMKEAAKKSHGHAQAQLGLIYLQGLGVEKNHKQAMKWIKRSVMQLNSNTCEEKGIEFYENVELDNNYEIALLYLRNAAEEEDSPIAQAQLGIMYLHGLGVERNKNVAKEWFNSSIKNMDESDCYEYGMKFCNGIEVEKNYTIALAFLRKAANQNHGLAQAQLGLMYLDGHGGVSKDKPKGMKWIEKSIDSMEQTDCYNLGVHLYNQCESEERLKITFIFMNKLAAKAHVLAKALLGEMFLEGKGVRKNQDKALKWFKHCLKTLDSPKCYEQGIKYYNGAGVETNYEIAMLYLQVAKLKKHALAQVQVGIMYLEGHGVEKDNEKAMECFQQSINEMKPKDCYLQGMALYKEHRYDISLLFIRRAAEEGHDLAQSQLGIMLLEGKAIPEKNQAESIKWIEKSLKTMNPHDCYAQGMALYCGTMVTKDYAISLRFMEKAAENHYGLAQAHMALFYYQGLGVDKNKDKALEWVEKSIIELRVECCNEDESNDDKWYGYEDECYTQGMKFYDGTEVDPDHDIALLYFRKAAERYHGLSQAQLALMYLEGSGVEKHHDIAMELIDKSMNNLDLDECYRQGMVFYHKTELENNYDIALQYLKRASKANAYAQAQLGYMYKNGVGGVDPNHEEAARWYNMVENNYIGDSRYCRSKIHHYDQGGMQDFSKAFKLYQEELGFPDVDDQLPNNADALRGIGLLYEYGDGATQDFKRAMKYYKRSILDEENLAAYYNIGLLYYYGKGVDQNYKEALLWFEKQANTYIDSQALHVFVQEDDTSEASNVDESSAKRKYSLVPDSRLLGESHYYIGLMYRNGYGVDQDEERAQNYFKMAHIHGIKRAKKNIS